MPSTCEWPSGTCPGASTARHSYWVTSVTITSLPKPAIRPPPFPNVDLEVTLVLLRERSNGTLKLWFAQAVPSEDSPSPTWTPITAWGQRVGNAYDLWFWRRVVSAGEWLTLLQRAEESGVLPTNSHEIAIRLVPRPPVYLPATDAQDALSPCHEEGACLWEWWDADKAVVKLLAEDRVQKINAHIRQTLGVDLDSWKDRLGNVLVIVPNGIRTSLYQDSESGCLVVRTTLTPGEAAAYELEVRGWDGEDLIVALRTPLQRHSVLLQDVPVCQRIEVSVWKDGALVHHEPARAFIRALSLTMGMHVGSRGGVPYTRRAASSLMGSPDPQPWTRLQRERAVDNRRAELARRPSLKFYAPDGTPAQRSEAVDDLLRIMNSAEASLRIWDPYFGRDLDDPSKQGTPEDDLYFLEQISDLDVSIQLLTSTDDWTASGGSARIMAQTQRFQSELSASPSRFGRVAWRAWVRSKDTAFHDRFIIVDEKQVWLLGSSFNGLGKKHTTLVQVEYPQEILVAFDRIWRGEIHGVGRLLTIAQASRTRHGA